MWYYAVVNFLSIVLMSWLVVKIVKRNFYSQMQWLLFKTPVFMGNKSIVNYFEEVDTKEKAFISIGWEAVEIVEEIQRMDKRHKYFYFEDIKHALDFDIEKMPNDIAIVVGNIDDKKQMVVSKFIENTHKQGKKLSCYLTLLPQTDNAILGVQKISTLLKKDRDTLILLQNKNDLLEEILEFGILERRLSVNLFEVPFMIYLDMMVFSSMPERESS